MRIEPRQWLMVLGLLITLALVFSMDDESEDDLLVSSRSSDARADVRHAVTSTAVARVVTQSTAKSGAEHQQHYLDWNLLQGRAVAADEQTIQADLFKPQRWYIPPPRTAAELAPPAPVVPQPDFAYIGKLEDGPQGTVILLANANRLYSVNPGSNVDQVWRLDKEDGQNLYLTYLPLNLPKTLLKKSKLAATPNPASHLPADPDDLQGNL